MIPHSVGLLSSEFLLQLHTILNEAFTSVLYLLSSVASRSDEEVGACALPEAGARPLAVARLPIVAASVRVLGAWLAEDSLTLAGQVYELLPFLLEMSASSSPQDEDGDLLKFLLPGLCHMTAEDRARPLLMRAGLGNVLDDYLQKLWPLARQSRFNV